MLLLLLLLVLVLVMLLLLVVLLFARLVDSFGTRLSSTLSALSFGLRMSKQKVRRTEREGKERRDQEENYQMRGGFRNIPGEP